MKKVLFSEDKLDLLRKGDRDFNWESLDSKRCCVLCERTFTGRQVIVTKTRGGKTVLHCPTSGCAGTPREWVHPGNPLISDEAWADWSRLLSNAKPATL
ncbi:MAG: hypothetical protein ACJ8HU_09235 [Chthoniobacterales bacterium]|jgi:hypothetical protein